MYPLVIFYGSYLMIKVSEKSLTQRFDDSMSSFSSEKNTNFTT